ncbi:MAG: hypothetical protein K5694_03015 [Bacilli bacterium]|nr:hypothetical protein [Bacilli bacterium]
MASPDNLILSEIFEDNGKTSSKEREISLSTIRGKNILFSLKEYGTYELINDSENHLIYLEDLEEGGEIALRKGEKALLNHNDHPYPPMEYRLRIVDNRNGKSSLYLYKIEHLGSTSDHQYKDMIAAIARYDENLLYEADAKYLPSKRIYNSSFRSFYSILGAILGNKTQILSSLSHIVLNPILLDKRVVVLSQVARRQSPRSIIKNARTPSRDTRFSSKMVQTSDIPLNRYLKFMLLFGKYQLSDLDKKAGEELKKVEGKYHHLLKSVSPSPDNWKSHTRHQVDSFLKRINLVKEYLISSRQIVINIDKILLSEHFLPLSPSSSRPTSLIHYPRYLTIERRLYLPLYKGFAYNFANNYGSILLSPIKQTSKLFESYCLLTIDAAIRELGFIDVSEDLDYEKIVKHFARDEYEITLIYEVEAVDVSLAEKGEIYLLSTETRHRSPDFSLILKKDGVPLAFLVFDSKCRKSYVVQKAIRENKLQSTIRDYLSLRYMSGETPFKSPKIVDSFWFLLPDDGNDEVYPPIDQLEYRLVKLMIDGQEDDFVLELKDYLGEYLESHD